jgi:hypothetical protein
LLRLANRLRTLAVTVFLLAFALQLVHVVRVRFAASSELLPKYEILKK